MTLVSSTITNWAEANNRRGTHLRILKAKPIRPRESVSRWE